MAGAADLQITVRAGVADPVAMSVPPGRALGPLSIGRTGTWRVVAPGVLEEHAFLYFNGSELFLQSADPNSPVTVNGSAIPGDWTLIYAPCEITFGGARLFFGPPSEAARSRPPPVPSRPPPVPQPPVSRVVDLPSPDDSTRQVSLEELQSARRPLPRDPPGATLKSAAMFSGSPIVGAPIEPPPSVMGPGPLLGQSPPGAPLAFGPDAQPPAVAPDPRPAPKASGIGAMWREASGPKKAMVALMAPLIWAVWVIFADKLPPPRPAKPAQSAAVSPSSTPSAAAAASSAPAAVEPPAPVRPSPATTASGKAAAGPTTSVKTREREAADAVAAGAYDKAARLYDELAKQHPDVPAYAEAARIMKAKANKR